ncbi:spinster family MFS transporter [Hyphococcus luteus]|nr:MFS transporter [Marinicaulis flavus]
MTASGVPQPSAIATQGKARQGKAAGTSLPYFLLMMFLVSTLNMADRQIIGIVAEPVKNEFGLSDTMLGLVGGTAFALVYPTLGLVIARIADRLNRRNILAACLALWSAMTMLCGVAPGFWFLAAARTGVAVGEAGYAPCTHSLIADSVSPARRATAFSVIVLGISAGGLVASIIGGLVAENYGWRAAFLALGAPGLVVSALTYFTLKEPPRLGAAAPPRSAANVFGALMKSPAFLLCVTGSAFHLMVSYGLAAFGIAYFVRAHEMSVSEAAVILGSAAAVAGAVGSVIGGAAGDFLAKRDRRWLAWWPALTVFAATFIGVPAFLTPGLIFALIGAVAAVFFGTLYQPASYALVQGIADPRERASAAALMIFIQNLAGLGLGPLLIGLISDALTPSFGVSALGIAIACVFLLNIPSAAAFYLSGRFWGRADA